jgi:FtsH-binding integral membrane protein
VASLTFYAIITKRDFASGMAILVAFIASTFMFWLFFFINWTSTAQIFYSSIGIFVFGLYLVIDTQLIMGGRKIALSIDDYVVAALLLYIDIIQIFLYILSLLTNKNRR